MTMHDSRDSYRRGDTHRARVRTWMQVNPHTLGFVGRIARACTHLDAIRY